MNEPSAYSRYLGVKGLPRVREHADYNDRPLVFRPDSASQPLGYLNAIHRHLDGPGDWFASLANVQNRFDVSFEQGLQAANRCKFTRRADPRSGQFLRVIKLTRRYSLNSLLKFEFVTSNQIQKLEEFA